MARKVRTKTKNGVVLYKEIIDDGKPSWIHQTIVDVGKDMLKVKSSKGKEYWVAMSDRVAMTMNPKVDDIAVIYTLKDGWIVSDIIPYTEPVVEKLSEEEEQKELERQLKEMNTLLGGY